jgi:hypothetical protein
MNVSQYQPKLKLELVPCTVKSMSSSESHVGLINLCSGKFSLQFWTSIIHIGEVLPGLKDQFLIWVWYVGTLGNSSTSSIRGSPKVSVFVLLSLAVIDILPLFHWPVIVVANVIVMHLDVELVQYLTMNMMLAVSMLMMIMDKAMLAVFTFVLVLPSTSATLGDSSWLCLCQLSRFGSESSHVSMASTCQL